jgi:hypothetical protein
MWKGPLKVSHLFPCRLCRLWHHYLRLISVYLLIFTTDSYNAGFTAKCPELTKGSWPAWWYHTILHLQKEGVPGLVKGDWPEPTTCGREL